MNPFPDVSELIHLARREDFGGDDVTSRLLIDESAKGVGMLVLKEPGIVCGLPIVQRVCAAYHPDLRVEMMPGRPRDALEGVFHDGDRTPLARVVGPMRALLSAERVILNFLQRMSGVATLTGQYVRRVVGTNARIYDTRKTIPGFRLLDKYAVVAGGGFNHRIGLYDGLLVKDNHLAHKGLGDLAAFVGDAVGRSRAEAPDRFIEIEVDRLDQLAEVLKVDGIDVILLDNMDCPTMRRAVAMRDSAGKRVDLEASGGVSLETVRGVAETGVDRIAIGALTHSAPALDVGMDVEGR